MSRASKAKTENARSSLLSPQESQALDNLLGRRCASMATAVAQLFMALPHQPSTWSLQHTGVVCLIKDNPQRSYFFRMYDLKAGRMLWEQELYNQIVYSASPQLYFHTFAADDCQVGLNFADQQEAEAFREAVVGKISQRNNRQERGSLPPVPPEKSSVSRGSFHKASVDIPSPDNSQRYHLMPSASSLRSGNWNKKDKKNKKKGLSKADIGAPSGFKHVTHVGFDPNNLDPDLWNLLSQAGIGKDDLRDEQTSQQVYNIIERSGGMEAVKREAKRAAGPPAPPPGRLGPLPPVPVSTISAPTPPPPRGRSGPLPPIPAHLQQAPQGASNRGCPPPLPPTHGPPPPSSKSSHAGFPHNALPPVPTMQHQRTAAFTPPAAPSPPSRGISGDPAPPPPPPPPPPLQLYSDTPPPPLPPSSSLPSNALSSVGRADSRGALLDQIRLGKKLRNVSECPDVGANLPAESGEGIVGALKMVMQKRSKAIHSSDESEEEGGGDDEDDDDEWDD